MNPIPFTKMHGLGNDFVIVDDRKDEHVIPFNRLPLLARRKTGIGFDQFIVLKRSVKADVFMQIINADNSEVDACGNATRCVAWLIAEQKQLPHVTIETNAGILSADITGNQRVRVNMGKPTFEWNKIPLAKNVNTDAMPIDIDGLSLPIAVNVGNPHAVFFTDDVDAIDLAKIGPTIENHELFPERVNVSIAQILTPSLRGAEGDVAIQTAPNDNPDGSPRFARDDEHHIKLRVWERGTGLTDACGTAACATLVAAVKQGFVVPAQAGTQSQTTKNKNIIHLDSRLEADNLPWAHIHLPGGRLRIEWDKAQSGNVFMTGDVATSFFGAF